MEGFASLFSFFFFFKELVAICAADRVSNLPCPIDSWPKQRLPLFASKRKTATDRMDFPDLSSFIGEELGLEKVGLLAVLDAISTRASCPIGGVPQTNVTMAILPRSGDADSVRSEELVEKRRDKRPRVDDAVDRSRVLLQKPRS